jgi:simple sugar transport system substrate-binding protein
MSKPRRALGAAAIFAIAGVGLAACSSSGGASSASSSSGAAGGAAGQVNSGGKAYTIAMITHETPGDTFWDKIKAGANASAKEHGITLKYSNDPIASNQATLIQNAVDSKVDGIATTLVTPDALAGAVKSATAAKIPVVGFNSGIGAWKQLGALMYFGSDENLAGNTVGEKLTTAGVKHPLCVIQAQGSVALEARCAGVKAKAPGTENLQVDGSNLQSTTSTLEAKLAQDKTIDGIVTLGAPIALAAIQAQTQANSTAKLATFDLNADAANAIKSGKIEFAIDQQPFVQGYEAVDSLWRYLYNGNDLGGGLAVLTGPSIVDKSNIDAISGYATRGTR